MTISVLSPGFKVIGRFVINTALSYEDKGLLSMNISDIVRLVEPEFLTTMTRSMKFFAYSYFTNLNSFNF